MWLPLNTVIVSLLRQALHSYIVLIFLSPFGCKHLMPRFILSIDFLYRYLIINFHLNVYLITYQTIPSLEFLNTFVICGLYLTPNTNENNGLVFFQLFKRSQFLYLFRTYKPENLFS